MGYSSLDADELQKQEIKKVNQRTVMDVITAYQTHINDFVNVSSRDLKNIMELIATKNDVRRRRYS